MSVLRGKIAFVTGTLGLFSLVDLFQLLASAKRSGRLAVEHPTGLARVYFEDGQVIHAEFGEVVGEEAVYALFADERGHFEFRIGMQSGQTTISRSTENLVLEAMRRLDEGVHHGDPKLLLSKDAVPALSKSGQRDLHLSDGELLLIEKVDGRRSVTSIAKEAGLDTEEALTVTERLLRTGVIKLQNRRARTARLVTRLSQLKLPPGAAGLEEAILLAWEKALGQVVTEVACKRENGDVLVFSALALRGSGPFLEMSRDTLFRANIKANETLLVRPVDNQPED